MSVEQNNTLSINKYTNSELDKPGMSTLKALSILFTPAYLQWRHTGRETKDNIKSTLGQINGVTHQIIDIAESNSDDLARTVHNYNEDSKSTLSKNQGMIYHLKHTKNSVSLN